MFGQGIRAINLIGQDTTCFGEDLGIKDGLAVLLAASRGYRDAAGKWIRFLYAYPTG